MHEGVVSSSRQWDKEIVVVRSFVLFGDINVLQMFWWWCVFVFCLIELMDVEQKRAPRSKRSHINNARAHGRREHGLSLASMG